MSATDDTLEQTLSAESDAAKAPSSPLAEQVFDTLRAGIVSGDFPPGARLRIRDLAEKVGTSVMPVREAVKRLVAEGLAVHEPYKGATVRELNTGELVNAYAVRILIEGEAARLGAEAATPEIAEQMYEHWHLLERAALDGDITEALHQDELLLGTLYEAAGNPLLLQIIRDLWDKCRPYRNIWAAGSTGRGGLAIWRNKPSLLVAVRNNDGPAAADIIELSYRDAQRAISATIDRSKSEA